MVSGEKSIYIPDRSETQKCFDTTHHGSGKSSTSISLKIRHWLLNIFKQVKKKSRSLREAMVTWLLVMMMGCGDTVVRVRDTFCAAAGLDPGWDVTGMSRDLATGWGAVLTVS